MTPPISTSDFASNAPEQIEYVAKVLGRSPQKLAVFEAVYYHKAASRSAKEIARRTKLTRLQVIKIGSVLKAKNVVVQTQRDGDIAYARRPEYHGHKREIISLVKSKDKRAQWVTKRSPGMRIPRTVTIPSLGHKARRLTIDDIGSFAKVRRIKPDGTRLPLVSETAFKTGVQLIIGEPGKFKDWGGEKSDLYTTRLKLAGKRRAAAFAFKGPGQKGKLVPGRMGKNGDQAQRLFQEEADVFLVQHWREIDPSVFELLRNLAVAKSVTSGQPIWYGAIDGADSQRLCLAYPEQFSGKTKSEARRARTRRRT